MKQISDIRKEITDLFNTYQHLSADDKDKKRAGARVVFLKTCIAYLESDPKHEFISSEIKRIENKINLIVQGFDPRYCQSGEAITKVRSRFEKQYNVPTLRNQLKTLYFIQ